MSSPLPLLTCMLICSAAATQAAPLKHLQPAIDPNGCAGSLVIGGGGGLPDEIYQRFIAISGGERANVVLVPTASSRADNPEALAKTLAQWQRNHPEATFSLLHTRDGDCGAFVLG